MFLNLLLILLAAIALWLAMRAYRVRTQGREFVDSLSREGEGAFPPGRPLALLGDIPAAVARLDRGWRDRVAAEYTQREVFLQIMNGLGEGILAIDRQRRIVLANRSAVTMLAMGESSSRRLLAEEVRVAAVLGVFDRALEGAESASRFSVRSGVAERRIEMRAFPVASDDIAAVALFLDITQLERLEQIRSNFISDFSHEVRTPMTGLRSAVETYDSASLTKEEDGQLRRIMTRQLLRLERLVDDLSELSRIESGDLSLNRTPINLLRIAEELSEDFAERAARQRIRFVVRGDGAVVLADAVRIQQAFSNILDNAIKYGGEGQTIEIEVVDGTATAEVRVSDEGEGIEETDRERIFRRFYRLDKSRSQVSGIGLGLAITKHIILLHRGTIDVESREGRGSTFRVILPKSGDGGP